MFDVGPTQFDLRFSLFGIPVRVHPAFWLVAAMMGWRDGRLDLVAVWIGCVFVSILIHEFGHAATAEMFGWPAHILLYHFGGLAFFQPHTRYSTGRAIAVSFAGPGAGFLLYGVVKAVLYALVHYRVRVSPYLIAAIGNLIWINLWWGLVNLLPVLPLDGGRISEAVCHSLRWVRDPQQTAIKLSALVSAGVGGYLLVHHDRFGLYPGLLFAVLCVQNVQGLQRGRW